MRPSRARWKTKAATGLEPKKERERFVRALMAGDVVDLNLAAVVEVLLEEKNSSGKKKRPRAPGPSSRA